MEIVQVNVNCKRKGELFMYVKVNCTLKVYRSRKLNCTHKGHSYTKNRIKQVNVNC